jgi:hypothetical protein
MSLLQEEELSDNGNFDIFLIDSPLRCDNLCRIQTSSTSVYRASDLGMQRTRDFLPLLIEKVAPPGGAIALLALVYVCELNRIKAHQKQDIRTYQKN